MRNAAKFGRTLAAFRNRSTWVCVCVGLCEMRCAVAQLGDGLISLSVWGDTARPSEAEGEKKGGGTAETDNAVFGRVYCSVYTHIHELMMCRRCERRDLNDLAKFCPHS